MNGGFLVFVSFVGDNPKVYFSFEWVCADFYGREETSGR